MIKDYKNWNEKIKSIDSIAEIIDVMEEYTKCGLAHNLRDYTLAYKWAAKLREYMSKRQEWLMSLPDGVPCTNPDCLKHTSHPCEECGRIVGKRVYA